MSPTHFRTTTPVSEDNSNNLFLWHKHNRKTTLSWLFYCLLIKIWVYTLLCIETVAIWKVKKCYSYNDYYKNRKQLRHSPFAMYWIHTVPELNKKPGSSEYVQKFHLKAISFESYFFYHSLYILFRFFFFCRQFILYWKLKVDKWNSTILEYPNEYLKIIKGVS